MRWEYYLLFINTSDFEYRLDPLGEDGWEVVCSVALASGPHLLFKRTKA